MGDADKNPSRYYSLEILFLSDQHVGHFEQGGQSLSLRGSDH